MYYSSATSKPDRWTMVRPYAWPEKIYYTEALKKPVMEFTKGSFQSRHKSSIYSFTYTARGKSYTITGNYYSDRLNTGFSSLHPNNYLIGYDSLRPEKGFVCYNRPYWSDDNPISKSTEIANTVGTVIFVNDH